MKVAKVHTSAEQFLKQQWRQPFGKNLGGLCDWAKLPISPHRLLLPCLTARPTVKIKRKARAPASTDFRLDADAAHVACWHIASFGCAAEFGRHRGIADIDRTAPTKL